MFILIQQPLEIFPGRGIVYFDIESHRYFTLNIYDCINSCRQICFFFFSACVQQQTLGTLRHIALSKHIQTYRSGDYVVMKYKSVNVTPYKYVHIIIHSMFYHSQAIVLYVYTLLRYAECMVLHYCPKRNI